MTQDHLYIVLGYGHDIQIYKYDGNQYSLIQTLYEPSDAIFSIDITDDHLSLAAGCFDTEIYIYLWNGTEFIIQQTLT